MENLLLAIWFTFRDGKVLFARKHGRPEFICVGGKIEPGEAPRDAVIREVMEETGVTLARPTVSPFAFYGNLPHPEDRTLSFLAYTATWVGVPEPRSEIAELAWVDSSLAATTPAGRIILDDLRDKRLIA